MDEINKTSKQLRDGEPCGHPGCLAHISHPCEVCGRIGGRMDEIDKKIEEYCQIIEKKAVTIYGEDDDPFGSVLDDRNTLVRIGRQLIEQLKECRRENGELNRLFDLQQTRMNKAVAMWRKATGKEDTLPDLGDLLEWLMGVIKQETGTLTPNLNRYLSKRDIERHAKEACKKALYSKIKRAPGTKFPYVPWRDIEQAIDEAKIE